MLTTAVVAILVVQISISHDKPERHLAPKYPQLSRSVYVQRVETVNSRDREAVSVSSLHMVIIFSLVDKPDIRLFPYGYYVVSLVVNQAFMKLGF